MELPHSKERQGYINKIKTIETNLKNAAAVEVNRDQLARVQKQLDLIAEKYQYSNSIGSARYKMYELQALVHYFNGNDEEALDFINQAIETRGENYARAEKLKNQLLANTPSLDTAQTPQKSKKRLVGLEGWLAIFTVGVGLSIISLIISLVGYPSAYDDAASAEVHASGFLASVSPLLTLEVIYHLSIIAIATTLLVLLAKHKRSSKTLAIIFLIVPIAFGMIDYAWASVVFNNYNLDSSLLNEAGGDLVRSILIAWIWVPYFLISKRVKATLTK